MRAGRLVDMLLILQRSGRVTARQLASELEVSTRTVLRDVDALSEAGIPIYTVQGQNGGIELVGGFRTELTGVTAGEAAALFLAGQPEIAARLGAAPDATAVRRKLIEALPPRFRDVAENIERWFVHDPDGWDGHLVPYGELGRLVTAIQRGVEAELVFADAPPEVVHPLGLVLKAGRWYLVSVAGDASSVRDLSDLRGLRVTRRRFERPDGFDLRGVWRTYAGGDQRRT